MQIEESSEQKEAIMPLNFNYSFTLNSSIRSWSDFTTTFLPVHFQQHLNHASHQQIEAFWRENFEQLSIQEEKVCILVPAELAKSDPKEVSQSGKKDGQSEKVNINYHNKHKSKGKQMNTSSKVPINRQIIEIGMELVTNNYPSLSFDYSSLFLGNQKQLLIYRRCSAIESYISKYRLPNNFKEPLQMLIDLTDQFHHLKLERNKAISSFNTSAVARLTHKIGKLNKEIDRQMTDFSIQWRQILTDFNSKPKSRDLLLKNISAQLISILRPICQQLQADIMDRYYECECDQYKDILVLKKNDVRLLPIDQRIYDEPPQEQVRYVYLQPQRQLQPPQDIRNIDFLRVDIKKKCLTYRVELRQCEYWNICEGIFIRSEEGEESYELNIDISDDCRSVDVDIYPYSAGKVSYQIYLWNSAGFTKSTERIVFFNQLQPTHAKRCITNNKQIYLLGQSQYGIKYVRDYGEDGQVPEMILFQYTAKQLSIKNAVMMCDQLGDVCGWGLMYYSPPDGRQMEEGKEHDLMKPKFRIQSPFLILRHKHIRKVSCGNGYCLMLSTFGSIYSMGTNEHGQLGLGDFSEGYINTQPRQICKFTNEKSGFMVDIKATSSGASFAINHRGQVYRWGFNQVSTTDDPILDRFGSIINYKTMHRLYIQSNPTKVTKNYISEAVRMVQDGEHVYFALTECGSLYGWGLSKFLGIIQLFDKDQNIVPDIVNPILILKNVAYISANFEHTIVVTTDNRVLAWGNSGCFTHDHQSFEMTAIDISPYTGDISQIKHIKAGKNFTAVVTHENKLKIIGKNVNFAQKEYDLNLEVFGIDCGEEQLIAILVNR